MRTEATSTFFSLKNKEGRYASKVKTGEVMCQYVEWASVEQEAY